MALFLVPNAPAAITWLGHCLAHAHVPLDFFTCLEGLAPELCVSEAHFFLSATDLASLEPKGQEEDGPSQVCHPFLAPGKDSLPPHVPDQAFGTTKGEVIPRCSSLGFTGGCWDKGLGIQAGLGGSLHNTPLGSEASSWVPCH